MHAQGELGFHDFSSSSPVKENRRQLGNPAYCISYGVGKGGQEKLNPVRVNTTRHGIAFQFSEELLRRKSGLGGEQAAASSHRLMYTCACASPQ